MTSHDPSAGNERLREIIHRYWVAPENAEWTQKRDFISLDELREWMRSEDLEIVGFADAMIHDRRFRIAPELSVEEYVGFIKKYTERCLRENREEGEWADSRYSAATDMVNIFGTLWWDRRVERSVLDDLKHWLGRLYKSGDEDMRRCIVHATLEHLVEQQPIRDFFSDWTKDPILKAAYEEACLWPDGGGRTSLGRPKTDHGQH